MTHTIFQGCGHYYARAYLRFTGEGQIVEGWSYIHPSETTGVTPPTVSCFESPTPQPPEQSQ